LAQADRLSPKVGGHPPLALHSSDEPGELSQWQCHDDSAVNIIVAIIIIIIIIIIITITWFLAHTASELYCWHGRLISIRVFSGCVGIG